MLIIVTMFSDEDNICVSYLNYSQFSPFLHTNIRVVLKIWYRLISAPFFPVQYRDADKSFARPTSRCILFDG
jgi:hypothetical protein